jgi:hypothetical protein
VTRAQQTTSPFASSLFLLTIFGLLFALSRTASASCRGAAEISPQRVTALRTLLSPTTAPGDFHVYAEAPGAEGQTHFVLYSIMQAADVTAPTVSLAAISLKPPQNVLSAIDVSSYLPAFARSPLARAAPTQADAVSADAPPAAGSAATTVDGCLNAFMLQPDFEAVHMNLFARSARQQSEGANDIVFVLLDHSSLAPVLELNQSSWHDRKGLRQDSVIAVLPSTAMVTELIWRQSSQRGAGIMGVATYDQNKWYRWNGKGFEKMGTLEEAELAARLRSASVLTRSDAISALEVQIMPGPNQPPP